LQHQRVPVNSAPKATVLAVDDKRANLLALEALLGDEYSLVFASSGEEALAALDQRKDIDVVLLDVQMPGMDGFETAEAMKKKESAKDIPIIFITAVYSEDPHVRRGYEAGGIDYFSKPFDPDVLKLKLRIYASFRTREAILRQRELHMRESEELLSVGRKLSSMLESLSVGVLIADAEGRLCQSTDEVSRIFRCAECAANDLYGEILGWWGRDGRMIKSENGPLARALQRGQASRAEPIEIRCCDGTSKTVLASASPLRGLDSRVVGAVVLLQDMTEPRRVGEALESRVSRLIGLGMELEQTAVAGSSGVGGQQPAP
jgi:CheY-like chemotaxis protein